MSVQREKRSGRATGVKHGSAGLGLLLLAAVAIAALVGAWLLLRTPAEPGSAGPPAPDATTSAAPRADTATPDPDASARAGVEPDAPARPREDPRRFEGRGSIRGELLLGDLAPPARWTLVLEPHPTLVGAEKAERRRVEYARGETKFRVDDLALGGYRVSAEVPSLNAASAPALLVRGQPDAHVTLRLARAGFVDGFAYDASGAAAEGLVVTLENARTRARTTTEVDATGMYVLRDVVDGDYAITFGPAESPLVPRGELAFKAPSLRWKETRLPPTGSARVRVVDDDGATIVDAEIAGTTSARGVLAGRTGGDGALTARHLVPGGYTVHAKSPDGRMGHATVEVRAGVRVDVDVRVR